MAKEKIVRDISYKERVFDIANSMKGIDPESIDINVENDITITLFFSATNGICEYRFKTGGENKIREANELWAEFSSILKNKEGYIPKYDLLIKKRNEGEDIPIEDIVKAFLLKDNDIYLDPRGFISRVYDSIDINGIEGTIVNYNIPMELIDILLKEREGASNKTEIPSFLSVDEQEETQNINTENKIKP